MTYAIRHAQEWSVHAAGSEALQVDSGRLTDVALWICASSRAEPNKPQLQARKAAAAAARTP